MHVKTIERYNSSNCMTLEEAEGQLDDTLQHVYFSMTSFHLKFSNILYSCVCVCVCEKPCQVSCVVVAAGATSSSILCFRPQL